MVHDGVGRPGSSLAEVRGGVGMCVRGGGGPRGGGGQTVEGPYDWSHNLFTRRRKGLGRGLSDCTLTMVMLRTGKRVLERTAKCVLAKELVI